MKYNREVNIKGVIRKLTGRKPKTASLFGQRIKERHDTLWKKSHANIHAAEVCKSIVMSKNDPTSKWHCCSLWQRKLSNKWNAREFASKFGCKVPDLYWHGRNIQELDFKSFPSYYVIRPTNGFAGRNIYVMANGTNLLDGKKYTEGELKRIVSRSIVDDPSTQILVEEFVRTESGDYGLPNEYKIHAFNEKIAAIQLIRRKRRKEAEQRFYTEDWKPFEDAMSMKYPVDNVVAPPKYLDDMLVAAKKLGLAYNMYVRIDFYATDKGCVFGEFTPTPSRGNNYTEYASQYFEQCWEDVYSDPDQV